MAEFARAAGGQAASRSTRRGYPRFDVAFPVEITLEGRDEAVGGTTLNVSRGGVLTRTDRMLPVGARCLVRFTAEQNRLSDESRACPRCGYQFVQEDVPRQAIWGRVLRSNVSLGGSAAAIEFETLLEVTETPRTGGESDAHHEG